MLTLLRTYFLNGGYSDYFVNLPEGLQDNVIARTMNSI